MSEDHQNEPGPFEHEQGQESVVKEPKSPPPLDTVATIEEWWAREIHGSVLGRYTEAFNHVMGAVDRLKARFRQ